MKSITIIFILTSIIGTLLLFFSLTLFANNVKNSIIYEECCGGNICTDTYYTIEDNQCHLSLCEQMAFGDKKDCVYPGIKKLEGINESVYPLPGFN